MPAVRMARGRRVGALLGLGPGDARLAAVLLAGAVCLTAVTWFVGWLNYGAGDTAFLVTTPTGTVRLIGERDGHYELSGPDGVTVIEVAGGRARLVESPCNEPAWHGGWVERPGERIVCLPNRVVLEVVGGGSTTRDGDQEPDVDGVTH